MSKTHNLFHLRIGVAPAVRPLMVAVGILAMTMAIRPAQAELATASYCIDACQNDELANRDYCVNTNASCRGD